MDVLWGREGESFPWKWYHQRCLVENLKTSYNFWNFENMGKVSVVGLHHHFVLFLTCLQRACSVDVYLVPLKWSESLLIIACIHWLFQICFFSCAWLSLPEMKCQGIGSSAVVFSDFVSSCVREWFSFACSVNQISLALYLKLTNTRVS